MDERPRTLGESIAATAHLVPPDPLEQAVLDLTRTYDPGGYQLQCPVSGCGWHLLVPRFTFQPERLDAENYTLTAEGVPREDVELVLRTHIDLHACLTETDVRDAPLAPEPGR